MWGNDPFRVDDGRAINHMNGDGGGFSDAAAGHGVGVGIGADKARARRIGYLPVWLQDGGAVCAVSHGGDDGVRVLEVIVGEDIRRHRVPGVEGGVVSINISHWRNNDIQCADGIAANQRVVNGVSDGGHHAVPVGNGG
ncbi:hypothetical protein D3C75_907830 [compost metagenome]